MKHTHYSFKRTKKMPQIAPRYKNQIKIVIPTVHPEGGQKIPLLKARGCYAGQSCPCCRAQVGDTFKIACPICLKNKQNYNFPK